MVISVCGQTLCDGKHSRALFASRQCARGRAHGFLTKGDGPGLRRAERQKWNRAALATGKGRRVHYEWTASIEMLSLFTEMLTKLQLATKKSLIHKTCHFTRLKGSWLTGGLRDWSRSTNTTIQIIWCQNVKVVTEKKLNYLALLVFQPSNLAHCFSWRWEKKVKLCKKICSFYDPNIKTRQKWLELKRDDLSAT